MKQVIKSLLFAFCVIGAPTNVYAYPFQPNPASFQKYMNTVKWSPGNKVRFQDLSDCNDVVWGKFYLCESGFVTWTNPKGTRVCDVKIVSFRDQKLERSPTDPVYFDVTGCRWK